MQKKADTKKSHFDPLLN